MSLFQFGFSRRSGDVGEKEVEGEKEVDKRQTDRSTSDIAKSKERYEEKRKMLGRGFRKEWKEEYTWLEYNEEEGKMYCRVCKDFPNIADKSSSFFTGNNSFHVGNVKGHDQSRRHVRCEEAKKAREVPEATPIHKGIRNLNQQTLDKLEKLFNTAYYLAKSGRPFSDFNQLCILQVKNGVSLGETYLNDKRCREFIEAIAEVMKRDQKEAMNSAQPRFFTLMADSGTDTSNKDLEIIYVRMLCDGEPINKFLTIAELPNGTADGVIESFERAMGKVGVNNWKNALVSLGSDGASVYTGVRNGVVAKLRQSIPWLLGIHCIAHNLELAILDGLKEDHLLSSVKEMLQSIYKHYHYSPKALRELKELAETMEEKIQKPGNLKGTRWVPHLHRALKVFLKDYKIIYGHFNNTVGAATSSTEMQGRAKKILKQQEKFKTVLFANFMVDVLDCLSKLSSLFQKDAITLTAAKDGLDNTILQLTAMIARPGPCLQEAVQSIGDGNDYQGITLKRGEQDLIQFNNTTKPQVINCINAYLEQRFENIKGSDQTLLAMSVFDITLWPDDRMALATYGEDKIHHLVEHFRLLLDKNDFKFDAVLQEWSGLKTCICNNYLDLNPQALWKRVFTYHSNRFPNVLMLVEITLILPLSTACCERGFSVMGKIKSDWRSCLSVEVLDCLMRIRIEGPTVAEFDPQPGLNFWWSSGSRMRRPTFND